MIHNFFLIDLFYVIIPIMDLSAARKLEQAGFNDEQIEALNVVLENNMATKFDIAEVKREIEELRAEVKRDIAELRAEVKREIEELRAEVKREIEELRAEVNREIAEVKRDIAEVKRDIAELRAEVKRDIAELRRKLSGIFKY